MISAKIIKIATPLLKAEGHCITKMEPLAPSVQILETLKSLASTGLVAKRFSAVVVKLVCMVKL